MTATNHNNYNPHNERCEGGADWPDICGECLAEFVAATEAAEQ